MFLEIGTVIFVLFAITTLLIIRSLSILEKHSGNYDELKYLKYKHMKAYINQSFEDID